MRALAKHGSLKEAQRSGLRRLARQDSPALKQSILRADAPPPGRPGASLAISRDWQRTSAEGVALPPSCARRRAATCFIAISACRSTGTSAGVSSRDKGVSGKGAQRRRGAGAHLEEEGAVYDRVTKGGATRQLLKWCEERRNKEGVEAPSRGVGGGSMGGLMASRRCSDFE